MRTKTVTMFVNRCKRTGKFLLKRDGVRLLTDFPMEADQHDSREDARDAGEHLGRQPYAVVSYASVRHLNNSR